jgi:signal recognition particle GTPase
MVDVVKDAAGIAMEAINYARDSKIDVVLVDTAGRMQVRGYCTLQRSITVLFLILRLS